MTVLPKLEARAESKATLVLPLADVPLLALNRPLSITACFALASYATLVTGTALACAVWLPAFEVPPGTASYRPMVQSTLCLLIVAATTLLGIAFAVAALASNPRRPVVWVVSACLTVASLAPFPVATRFSQWVFVTQGLELAP